MSARPGPARYRRADVATARFGAELDSVHCHDDGGSHLVSPDLVDVLRRCDTFASLDEHAARIARDLALDGPERRSLRDDLDTLLARGLMVPWTDLRAVIDRAPSPAPGIGAMAIVTRDRLDALERGLASWVAGFRRHGRRVDLVVMDDSPSADTRAHARAILAAHAGDDAIRLLYAGREEKQAFAREIAARSGVPTPLIDFALFGAPECDRTYGANRNAVLLHTIGQLVFGTDDDTIARAAPRPGSDDGLAFTSAYNPTQLGFFAAGESAAAAVQFVDRDVLGVPEQLLGKGVAALLAKATSPPDVEGASPAFLRRLRAGDGRVVATMMGLVGKLGMGSPRPLLDLEGADRESLVASAAIYRAAMEGGDALRGALRPTVCDSGLLTSMCLGLDNRAGLPPFFPVLRGEDIVFGQTLRACFEDACFGFLPWVVLHAPIEERSFEPGRAIRDLTRTSMTQIVTAALQSADVAPEPIGGARSVRALGRHLVGLGSLPPGDFEEFVRMARWRFAGNYIQRLAELLQTHDHRPDYWAQDLTAAGAALREAFATPAYLVPYDLADGRDAPAARQLGQRLLLDFGRLLDAWPAIVDAARGLRDEGRGLARPV